MKKTYLVVILLLAVTATTQAQIKFGAKAGVLSTSVNADETYSNIQGQDYESLKVQGKKAKINGFQFGLFGRISITALYIQPELMFNRSVTEVEVEKIYTDGTDAVEVVDQKFNKIDIPIMAGWKFGPARIQAGPVASIVLSNQSAIEAAVNNAEEEFNNATWGYQVGAGLDLLNTLTIDIKYEGSLSKFGDGVTIGDQKRSFDSRPNQFILSLGLFF